MPRSWLLTSVLSLLFLLNSLLSAGAVATNRTIDDSLGDSATGVKPIYRPSTAGVWEDETCIGCAIVPSTQLAFKGTWTAATYNSGLKSISIELNFKGTAVYVFFILANYVAPGITTETACNFTLDGAHAGLFSHTPTLSTDLQYNALVFSNNNLQNTDHKLIIETNDVDHDVFVNFDYAIYTFDDTVTTSSSSATSTTSSSSSSSIATSSSSPTTSAPTTSSSSTSTDIPGGTNNGDGNSGNNNPDTSNGASSGSKTNIAAIVGGTVGGVVALAAIVFALLFCLRRRERRFNLGNDFPATGDMFAPLSHSNESTPVVAPAGRPRNVPPPLPMDQHYSRAVTHSDFIQSGTIMPSAGTISPGMSSDSDQSPYGGVIEAYTMPPPPTQTPLRKQPLPTMPDPTSVAGLAPVRRPSESASGTLSVSGTSSSEETRRSRQQELESQLRSVTAEMRALKGDVDRKSSVRTRRNPSQDREIQNMRDQMQIMSEQIQMLRSQQGSQWAQGLSDEPPPGYTPSFSVRNS